MSLIVVQAELLKTLGLSIAEWLSDGYQVGLFQNDWTPAVGDTISAATPASFGGYDGLRTISGWTSASWSAPRASATADTEVWTADGGSGNIVYGYYVVDSLGALAWAERNPLGGFTISVAGQTYSVTPTFTRRSEF